MFQQFKAHNESKNIFKAAKTPAVFFAIAVIFYILSGIFGLLGIYSIANLCNLSMGLALVTLITWAYIRYSGEMVDFGRRLDEVALMLWEGVNINLRTYRSKTIFFGFVVYEANLSTIRPKKSGTGCDKRGNISSSFRSR